MKAEQVSFAAGEISPILHARTDLARYRIGLAELVNMIVLPQGGITRRAGAKKISSLRSASGMRLIPFEYSTTDSVILEFGDKTMSVWQKGSGDYASVVEINTPYSLSEVKDLRYVQSGNVMFLTHINHKPQVLRRNNLTSWSIEELKYKGGPWVSSSEWMDKDVKLFLSGNTLISEDVEIFHAGMAGALILLEYPKEPKTHTIESSLAPNYSESASYEVKGTLNVTTSGEWRGIIAVDRSIDGGATWVTVRQYNRQDTETQGQWDFTISEAEDRVVYRVRAQHDTLRTTEQKKEKIVASGGISIDNQISVNASGSGGITSSSSSSSDGNIGISYTHGNGKEDTPATVNISVSGFLKREVYKIVSIVDGRFASVEQESVMLPSDELNPEVKISFWSIGAWGDYQGYPRACTMYQDRLILAGSKIQPQTVWMSRTGDYADFSTSDPLRDDDAVNLTLAGTKADGIHSLIGEGALLAFTRGGEWLIRGNGDSGAITPTALTAKQQSNIGTKDIQPFTAGGNVIRVQSQGQKVFALGYDLNTDGYTGSELSIMSRHIFKGKQIIGMAYQSEPDSLLWFVLNDGTCAVCTYNPEHEVIGWSRQEFSGKVNSLASMSGIGKTELVGEAEDSPGYVLISMKDRTEAGGFTDWGGEPESRMRTLRVIAGSDEGSTYTSKELISRLIISVLDTGGLWAAPGDYSDEPRNWERRRKIAGDNTEYIQDLELQMDNGFNSDACIQIRSMEGEPLTIAGITPIVTAGG